MKRTIYLDGVDFQHEIGEAMGGNMVYPSAKDLKKNSTCWESCGIVEAEVTFVKWVEPQDFSKSKGQTGEEYEAERAAKGEKQLQLEHLEQIKDYFTKRLSQIKKRIKEAKKP